MKALELKHKPISTADIQVGDVFHSSWGCGMSLNTFYRVVSRTNCFVTLRELRKIDIPDVGSNGFSGMQYPADEYKDASNIYDGHRVVVDGKAYSQVKVKIPSDGRLSLKIHSFEFAYPWDGKGHYYNHLD